MVGVVVDGFEVEMDLELGIAEKVKMGRRRVQSGYQQESSIKITGRKRASRSKSIKDAPQGASPPEERLSRNSSLEDPGSEEEIPSSQPVGVRRMRKSRKQALRSIISSKGSNRKKREEVKDEVSEVVMGICQETGEQCLATLLSSQLVKFYRRPSDQDSWQSKGSVKIETPPASQMYLLATTDSLVLQSFITDKLSLKEMKINLTGDNNLTTLLSDVEIITEVHSCNLGTTSCALFWNLVGGKASGAVYDWGTDQGAKKHRLTHLISWRELRVTGVVKMKAKNVVAASTSDNFVSFWSLETGQQVGSLSLATVDPSPWTGLDCLVKMVEEGGHIYSFLISEARLRVMVVRPDQPALEPLSLKIPTLIARRVSAGAKVMVQGPIITLLVAGMIVRWQVDQTPIHSTVAYLDPFLRQLDGFFV